MVGRLDCVWEQLKHAEYMLTCRATLSAHRKSASLPCIHVSVATSRAGPTRIASRDADPDTVAEARSHPLQRPMARCTTVIVIKCYGRIVKQRSGTLRPRQARSPCRAHETAGRWLHRRKQLVRQPPANDPVGTHHRNPLETSCMYMRMSGNEQGLYCKADAPDRWSRPSRARLAARLGT